jgi:hypothetical protein
MDSLTSTIGTDTLIFPQHSRSYIFLVVLPHHLSSVALIKFIPNSGCSSHVIVNIVINRRYLHSCSKHSDFSAMSAHVASAYDISLYPVHM